MIFIREFFVSVKCNYSGGVKYFHCRPVKVFFTNDIVTPCKFSRETKFFEEELILSSR